MGYNLYITRRKDPADDSPGAMISIEEWQTCVTNDLELRMDDTLGEHTAVWSGPSEHEVPWLQWNNGSIETKYPDDALIAKMASIAASLNAHVEGEDGEIYDGKGSVNPPERRGLIDRVKNFFTRISAPPPDLEDLAEIGFKVGDRVHDVFGDQNLATVTKIDLAADHGMGRITVRYDDGRIGNFAAIAHGLELIPKE